MKPSFLSSGAGVYTLGALISHNVGKQDLLTHFVEKVKGYYQICFGPDVDNGLLNGQAGYLFCLLKLQTEIKSLDFTEYIVSLVTYMYDAALKNWGQDDKIYFGAMNGIIGIIYLMLRGIQIVGGQNFR